MVFVSAAWFDQMQRFIFEDVMTRQRFRKQLATIGVRVDQMNAGEG